MRTSGRTLLNCLCCGSSDLRVVLDLGKQPLANGYTDSPDESVEHFPLELNVCGKCWHAQLSYCVDRHAIFDRYAYTSGTSSTLNHFFAWFAHAAAVCLKRGARVLELAANDGSLIQALLANGLDAFGIDPAQNIVESAQSRGLPLRCGYWPQTSDIAEGTYDAIVCMNVVAHVDDPQAFVAACCDKLCPGGVLLIQPSQVRMFGNGEFDTCYHEHISFFNTRSMAVLAESSGLKLYGSALVRIHGDSPIYILGRSDAPPAIDKWVSSLGDGAFAISERLSDYEAKIGLYEWDTYHRFRKQAQATLNELACVVAAHRSEGFDIVFVGAAAKAMTVINAAGIRPDRFLDEAVLKIGLCAPGIGTRIEPLEVCTTLLRPALFVITAWNFRQELHAKLCDRGVPVGSKFYCYFPVPEYL
ncbi:class I SAM-dependent methyltransferase [Trinickia acidisoli]|uniref:class I SAM-dependent methyltransferase n=1 Tax=Trinickia acidisoli TaxID=2767482 RepID=UPI002852E734|nr:class I SAM-dependent methyltransferase [Trinickia acidisoli]